MRRRSGDVKLPWRSTGWNQGGQSSQAMHLYELCFKCNVAEEMLETFRYEYKIKYEYHFQISNQRRP